MTRAVCPAETAVEPANAAVDGSSGAEKRSTSWLDIWTRKGKSEVALKEPLHHVSGFTQITEEQYRTVVRTILSSASLSEGPAGEAGLADANRATTTLLDLLGPGAKVMEFGCGGGGFLNTVNQLTSHRQLDISGVDYSPSLVQVAKQRVPQGNFSVQDIRNVRDFQPDDSVYDVTFCYSVLFYLNNLEDAYQALSEMVRVTKSNGRIVVAEVSDLDRRHIDEQTRQQSDYYNSAEYKKHKSETPPHLFIPKSFFLENADKLGLRIDAVVDESDLDDIASYYDPAKWRYTVFATKL